jgi:RNA recognition motif-containing protein
MIVDKFVDRRSREKANYQRKREFQEAQKRNNLYVCGFPNWYQEDNVRKLFEFYGQIKSIKVINGNQTYPHGFVCFENNESSQNAKEALNGSMIDGCQLQVRQYEPKRNQHHNQGHMNYDQQNWNQYNSQQNQGNMNYNSSNMGFNNTVQQLVAQSINPNQMDQPQNQYGGQQMQQYQ